MTLDEILEVKFTEPSLEAARARLKLETACKYVKFWDGVSEMERKYKAKIKEINSEYDRKRNEHR